MTFNVSRRLYVAPVLVGWLSVIAVGSLPLDGLSAYSTESLVPRMLLWFGVLVMASVGARARYWKPSIPAPLMADVRMLRRMLFICALVVVLDVVANTLVLAVLLGGESIAVFGIPLFGAAFFSARALADLAKLMPVVRGPAEWGQ